MPGLLALLAHPDDEFFCGGLLAGLSARGIPIHLAYWTRGEGGGSPRARLAARFLPSGWRPRVRAAKRAAALLRAASLTFLDGIDPVPAHGLCAPAQPPEVFLQKLSRLVLQRQPELLLTHGSQGDYGHPAHRRLHELAREFAAARPGLPLLSFNASGPACADASFLNRTDPADFVFDAEPYADLKRKLVLAHGSQKAALEALAGGNLDQLLRLTRYEGYHYWSAPEAARATLDRWLKSCAQ